MNTKLIKEKPNFNPPPQKKRMNTIDKTEEEILLGIDESNGVDYTCKTYGYIKK